MADRPEQADLSRWQELARKERKGTDPDGLIWHTPEGIDVKPVYVAADRDAAVAAGYPLDSFPGEPPYVRGPYPTM